jgi:hypothetical protein
MDLLADSGSAMRNSELPVILSTIINPINEKETKYHTLVPEVGGPLISSANR